MGTTVNTTNSVGKGVISAEELSRMLMESSTRKAPVAAKPRKRPEDEAIPETSSKEAPVQVKEEGEVAEELEKEALTEGESGEKQGEAQSEGGDGGVASSSDDVIELAQAPSGAAAVVKPAAVATEEGAAAGIPLLFLGGGALGIALLDDDDGGGGAAPSPQSTPPPAPGEIASFEDFNDQAGTAAPNEITVTAEDTGAFLVHGGFDRSLLPDTLANLEEHLVYDLNEEEDAVDHHGLQVNLEGDASAFVLAVAAASGTTEDGAVDSDIVWLANLGVVGEGLNGPTEPTGDESLSLEVSFDLPDVAVGAAAYANDGGDAEVGVSNLYVDLSGSGTIEAAAFLGAGASEDAKAAAFVGNDMTVDVNADSAYAKAEVWADADSGSTAETAVGGDLLVIASGEEYANAHVSSVSADASGDLNAERSSAQVSIGGDVLANASAAGVAYASVDDVEAEADDHSDAHVSVGGSVQANAVATEGAAYASVSDVEADAYSFAVASVSIGGDVSANASGVTYASATVESISADAEFGSMASVSVGGSVEANAMATEGGAFASVSNITASASTSSEAEVSIAGDVLASAIGTSEAAAYIYAISADASDGEASVSIGGSVEADAVASDGYAYASVTDISADADDNGNAQVSIGGDVLASAAGEGAYATVSGIDADAYSAVATVSIGGSVEADATASDGDAYANVSDISADADYGGTAVVSIGGDVLAKASASAAQPEGEEDATSASAYAIVEDIDADAYYGGSARVSIGGDVSANAVAVDYAQAQVDSIDAYASAGESTEDPGSIAEVLIDGCVHAHATASSGGAQATISDIEAEAGYDSNARVVIGSDVDISADGEWASAYGGTGESSFIDAYASYGGTAEISIGGSVMADASATDGAATASMDNIEAQVYGGGGADVDVAGDVSAKAAGTHEADARIDFIGADVWYGGAADVSIAGDVKVDATASAPSEEGPVGNASASIDSISAYAYGGGDALVSIGGDVSATAAGDAYADADVSINAYAGGVGSSSARVQIGGNVVVSAVGASASADLSINASGSGEIDVAGDVSLSVSASDEADTASASGYINAWSSASIMVGDINLSVMGGSSHGNLDIIASSSAAIVADDIVVTVDEGACAEVDVHAYDSAEIYIGNVVASVGDGGKASFDIGQIAGDAATDADRSATFSGAGDVCLELEDQIFGTINVGSLDGAFDLALCLGDSDEGSVPFTVINGFEGETDSVIYNGEAADEFNFIHVGTFTDEGELFTELGLALDGTHDYAFAVYTGVDITGDGVDEVGLGVLAYDQDGYGMTSVLYLPDIVGLTPDDLGNGGGG